MIEDITIVSCSVGQYHIFDDNFNHNIPQRYPRIIISEQDIVKPFTRGRYLNIGIKRVETKWVMIVDIDLEIPSVFWSCDLESGCSYNGWVSYFPDDNKNIKFSSDRYPTDSLTAKNWNGGMCIVETETIKKIHGFNEQYFGWGGEDLELNLRLKRLGVYMVWLPIVLKHYNHDMFVYPDYYKPRSYHSIFDSILKENEAKNITVVNLDGWGEP